MSYNSNASQPNPRLRTMRSLRPKKKPLQQCCVIQELHLQHRLVNQIDKIIQADPVMAQAGKLRLLTLLDQFQAVRRHQTAYEQQIRAVLRQLPESKPIRTLPGVGKRLAPELVATLGPRRSHRRFDSAHALSNLAGSTPITQASGKWQKVRMRTACVKPLRRALGAMIVPLFDGFQMRGQPL
jgi:transposase